MNKVGITTISSFTMLLALVVMTNPVVASVDEDEQEESESQCDIIDSEHYDASCDYSRAECAQMFPPEYDYSSFQTCTGDVGWPNPGP